MSQPLLPWDSLENSHSNLVWRSKMDKRYLIEIRRTGDYQGRLCIFDHIKNNREIASWDVNLSYGAMFGPDVADVDEWCEKIADFIDNTYNK